MHSREQVSTGFVRRRRLLLEVLSRVRGTVDLSNVCGALSEGNVCRAIWLAIHHRTASYPRSAAATARSLRLKCERLMVSE